MSSPISLCAFTLSLVLLIGCSGPKPVPAGASGSGNPGTGSTDGPTNEQLLKAAESIDLEKGKVLALAAGQDLIKNDDAALLKRMDKIFQSQNKPDHFKKLIAFINNEHGKLESIDYKKDSLGKRNSYGQWKPARTLWYAAQTSKHPKGTHFLTVEIIQEDENLVISGFQIVKFPPGKIPSDLQ